MRHSFGPFDHRNVYDSRFQQSNGFQSLRKLVDNTDYRPIPMIVQPNRKKRKLNEIYQMPESNM